MAWPNDGVPSLILRRHQQRRKQLRRRKHAAGSVRGWPNALPSLGLRQDGSGSRARRRQRRGRVVSVHGGGLAPGGVAGVTRTRFYTSLRGMYRVFNAAEYRFYRSNSAPPGESDTPFATNATLPHTPVDTFADGTWYLSVSYFNGVIDSGFLPLGPNGETYLRLDISGGVVTNAPPNGPDSWHLETRAANVLRVVGVYYQSGALRADEWAIAYDPSSPPAADAPDATVAMPTAGVAMLSYDLPAGNTKVRLQTRRNDGTVGSPVWVYSEDSTVLTGTLDNTGPTGILAGEDWPGRVPEDV